MRRFDADALQMFAEIAAFMSQADPMIVTNVVRSAYDSLSEKLTADLCLTIA